MDSITKMAVSNQMNSVMGGGESNASQSIRSMSFSDMIATGGTTDTTEYKATFPPVLKFWYIDYGLLNDNAKNVLKHSIRVYWASIIAATFNTILWFCLGLGKADNGWIYFGLSLFFTLFYLLTFSWGCERTFYGMWQTDFRAMKAALGVYLFIVVNLFLNLFLGWGSYNGWLRYVNMHGIDGDSLLKSWEIFWRIMTAVVATAYTVLTAYAVWAGYLLHVYKENGPGSGAARNPVSV